MHSPFPHALPFHSQLLNLLWDGRIADLSENLQYSEPLWPNRQKTWLRGGCLILAEGLLDWMQSSPSFVDNRNCLPHRLRPPNGIDFSCPLGHKGIIPTLQRPQKLAVWESWDDEPYHVVVTFGSLYLDGEGVGDVDMLLTGWEEYFRGGAYLGLLSRQDALVHGIPHDDLLSFKIARELRSAFGPFHPGLLQC